MLVHSSKTYAVVTGQLEKGGNVYDVTVRLNGRRTSLLPSQRCKKELNSRCYKGCTGVPLILNPIDSDREWEYYDFAQGYITGLSGAHAGVVFEITSTLYPVQVGRGASGKNINTGLSFTFNFKVVSNPSNAQVSSTTGQGDFSMDFAKCDSVSIVSEWEPNPAINDGVCNREASDHAVSLPFLGDDGKHLVYASGSTYVELSNGKSILAGTITKFCTEFLAVTVFFNKATYGTTPSGSPDKDLAASCYGSSLVDTGTFMYYQDFIGFFLGPNSGSFANSELYIRKQGTAMQIGDGANNKNKKYGFSAGFSVLVAVQSTGSTKINVGSSQSGFNVNLVCPLTRCG